MNKQELSVFAVAAPGLEQIIVTELAELGITGKAVPGGVEWRGDLKSVRRSNLHLRTASRVLVRVAEFKSRTFFELERHAAKVDWRSYLSTSKPVFLRVSSTKSKLYHEGAIAERLYKAIRAATGAVPVTKVDEEAEGSDMQMFVVRVMRDEFTISADSSGALLHMRGYRQELGRAPLRETLAAALLRAAQYNGRQPLLDPLCGSGTIPIEAALLARNIPPGLASPDRKPRTYAFESWPTHDRRGWETDVQHARGQIRTAALERIYASDRDEGALSAARANAARAGVQADIEFNIAALSAAPHPKERGLLVTNPPYGIRVSEGADLRNLYAALGRYVQEEVPDWTLTLMSADQRLDAQIGLPLRVVAETKNGGIGVRILSS